MEEKEEKSSFFFGADIGVGSRIVIEIDDDDVAVPAPVAAVAAVVPVAPVAAVVPFRVC